MFTYTEAKEIINTLGRFTITSSETNHVHTMVTIDTEQGEYLIGSDIACDIAWEESLDNYLEECLYPELPESLRSYFDDEAWKRDAKHDGRGHSLSSYDGQEIEFDNCDLYAYRTN